MTEFSVTFMSSDMYHIAKKRYKVRHFRQFNGKDVSTNGGYTCLFDLDDGRILVSKCRNDEQFSRRKGILTCLQKYLLADGIATNDKIISGYKPSVDSMVVTLGKNQKPYWWL